MAFEIWSRAQAKWRGILVYVGLQVAMRLVTALIYDGTSSAGLRVFASLAGAATGIYCVLQMWNLLLSDQPGDESWPPLWS
jgi:hypothetical protein